MGSGIILCGGNGAGKSTLGEALARKLGRTFLDIETYYFPNREADYTYAAPRTQEEATKLLLEDMRRHEKFVFAAVKGNYGEEVVSMLTGAVLLSVPKAIRMKRVKDRSYQKFGDRILPGGDLHRQEERFFAMVENRSEQDVEQWLDTVPIPVLRVDGTQSIDSSVRYICARLARSCQE